MLHALHAAETVQNPFSCMHVALQKPPISGRGLISVKDFSTKMASVASDIVEKVKELAEFSTVLTFPCLFVP